MTLDLYNDDCLQALSKMKENSVDLILTDPPYNLGNFMRDRQCGLMRMRDNVFVMAGWDDDSYETWKKHMDSFFAEANRVLKPKGALVMFMSLIKAETIVTLASQHKLYYKTTGVWHKTNPMPRNMNLHFINSLEGWLYFINQSKTGTFNNEGKAIHDFVETSVAPAGERAFGNHPTQKPESLMAHFIRLLSHPGDVVLDPFMGSGATGVAATRLSRNYIGVEIDPGYFHAAKSRIEMAKTITEVASGAGEES